MISAKDREILRRKANIVKELAMQPENIRKRQKWYDVDDLKKGAEPVFMTHLWQISTPEIFPAPTFECETEEGRRFELALNEKIYYATVLDDDNVVEPTISYRVDHYIEEYPDLHVQKRYAKDDVNHEGAAEFIPAIVEYSDIDKLTDPVLHYNKEKTEENKQQALEIFGDILTVVKHPVYFAAKVVDEFSWLRGIEQTYIDMADDPEWMAEALTRIMNNFQKRFTLLEEAGIWGCPDKSDPLGSAGLRYISGMQDYSTADDPTNFAPKISDSWGFTCAEVCNVVSQDMHDEFSFVYDRQIMEQFKYINVGCCETLDRKIEIVHSLKNARKVSVSEWCDVERAADNIKGDYVYSYRAAGVPFIDNPWDKKTATEEITKVLKATKENGCNLEIVLNIGGTFGGNAREKLLDWTNMVRELIAKYH